MSATLFLPSCAVMSAAHVIPSPPRVRLPIVEEELISNNNNDNDDLLFLPVPAAWYKETSNSCALEDDEESIGDDEKEEDCHWREQQSEHDNNTNNQQQRSQQQLALQLPHTSHLAAPLASPSWKEISSHILPAAARELLSSTMQRICYTARLSYSATIRKNRTYSDMGNNAAGFYRAPRDNIIMINETDRESSTTVAAAENMDTRRQLNLPCLPEQLPAISNLSWVERQLVAEWRTYQPPEEDASSSNSCSSSSSDDNDDIDDDEADFDRARTLVPLPAPRPAWQRASECHVCRKPFGPTRLRHHCRWCGSSVCQAHAAHTHALPHLGYDPNVPERVCNDCKQWWMEQNLAERIAWRLARCRDYERQDMAPYFETGQDCLEQVVLRITEAALTMAKSIPLGAQASVAVETVDVLRRYGVSGIYTIMLRQEFLAAADLLRKALGINQSAWPLSVHELSAAIFYALAQHRAMRGMQPEREHLIHSLVLDKENGDSLTGKVQAGKVHDCNDMDDSDNEANTNMDSDNMHCSNDAKQEQPTFQPVCESVSDETLASLIFYAPMALNFIYAEKEVDMQLLAAQQGWRLVYAYMEQESGHKDSERPASALFLHEEQKIACIAVRGTATIHDVITDIRQTPVPFPDEEDTDNKNTEGDWTTVFRGHGLAVCGMAGAAMNLYREHIDSVLFFARKGYRIRLTGHSLGGGVATLLGAMIYRDLEIRMQQSTVPLRVYAYGTPSCVDARLAESVEPFVTSVILHDDVIPRLTPTSCRALLKHLLTIRDTWVKEHFPEDFMAIQKRAKTAWAPTFRNSFTMSQPTSSIKTYCRRKIRSGKNKLLAVTEKLCGDTPATMNGQDQMDASTERCETVEEFSLEDVSKESENNDKDAAVTFVNDEETNDEQPKLLLDYMGGVDCRSPGLVIDGDEFFDPTENLLEDSDSESVISLLQAEEDREHSDYLAAQRTAQTEDQNGEKLEITESLTGDEGGEDESPGAVLLEETPLPRMFAPGRIIHIYSHRGVYRCTYVPRAFRELRRISMAGNMLVDHKANPYYEALRELISVRQAPEYPPRWTAFDEDDSCSCCASRFTWASTSSSHAQQARDKHNCRSCGTLVCDPCSRNRIALPSIGLLTAARVCDRCYNDINGMNHKTMTSSFIHEEGETLQSHEKTATSVVAVEGCKPVRERERRSTVVDELASRVQNSTLTC